MDAEAKNFRIEITLGVFWLLLLLGGIVSVASFLFVGEVFCEHETGDSKYGEASWSWFPPGPVCSFTEEHNGVDDWGPGWIGSAYAAVMASGVVAISHFARRSRRPEVPMASGWPV